jgi:hypothetical protein
MHLPNSHSRVAWQAATPVRPHESAPTRRIARSPTKLARFRPFALARAVATHHHPSTRNTHVTSLTSHNSNNRTHPTPLDPMRTPGTFSALATPAPSTRCCTHAATRSARRRIATGFPPPPAFDSASERSSPRRGQPPADSASCSRARLYGSQNAPASATNAAAFAAAKLDAPHAAHAAPRERVTNPSAPRPAPSP